MTPIVLFLFSPPGSNLMSVARSLPLFASTPGIKLISVPRVGARPSVKGSANSVLCAKYRLPGIPLGSDTSMKPQAFSSFHSHKTPYKRKESLSSSRISCALSLPLLASNPCTKLIVVPTGGSSPSPNGTANSDLWAKNFLPGGSKHWMKPHALVAFHSVSEPNMRGPPASPLPMPKPPSLMSRARCLPLFGSDPKEKFKGAPIAGPRPSSKGTAKSDLWAKSFFPPWSAHSMKPQAFSSFHSHRTPCIRPPKAGATCGCKQPTTGPGANCIWNIWAAG
mmetsp:Transcript_92307/g.232168  ORF Transcript_92307/g.232168 Transcript_92307/m.232168 type:complete len:279 (+) Transcript_92307:93-929(+)